MQNVLAHEGCCCCHVHDPLCPQDFYASGLEVSTDVSALPLVGNGNGTGVEPSAAALAAMQQRQQAEAEEKVWGSAVAQGGGVASWGPCWGWLCSGAVLCCTGQ